MHHDRRAGLEARGGDRGHDRGHVADEPVLLDRALEERRTHAGVVDPLADVAHEELGELLGRPVAEELRQLHERVQPGRDDDVEVDLGVDPLEPRDEPAQPDDGRVDERPDPGLADRAQLRDRVRDAELLVPEALTPGTPVVRDRLGIEHEHVLVHERAAQVVDVDGAPHGLDRRHQASSSLSFVAEITWRNCTGGSAAAPA